MLIPLPLIVEEEEPIHAAEMPLYTCGCGCNSFPCCGSKEQREKRGLIYDHTQCPFNESNIKW